MEILVNKSTNSVTLGTAFLTTKLDLSSMDPLVESVVWDTVTEKGTKFFGAEAMVNGYLRPQEQIFGEEYRRLVGPIVDLAMDHWEARKNPYVMYRTGAQLNEGEYTGQKVLITTYPHPTEPPEGFTTIESPNPSEYDPFVQWTGSEWLRAPFTYNADILIQKKEFNSHISKLVSALINNQLRNYTLYDIIENGKSIEPSDYGRHGYPTMQDYINDLKESVRERLDLIQAAQNVDDLLAIQFDVDEIFS